MQVFFKTQVGILMLIARLSYQRCQSQLIGLVAAIAVGGSGTVGLRLQYTGHCIALLLLNIANQRAVMSLLSYCFLRDSLNLVDHCCEGYQN